MMIYSLNIPIANVGILSACFYLIFKRVFIGDIDLKS